VCAADARSVCDSYVFVYITHVFVIIYIQVVPFYHLTLFSVLFNTSIVFVALHSFAHHAFLLFTHSISHFIIIPALFYGATENAGLELNGPKSQRWKMKDERPRSIEYITHVVFTSSN